MIKNDKTILTAHNPLEMEDARIDKKRHSNSDDDTGQQLLGVMVMPVKALKASNFLKEVTHIVLERFQTSWRILLLRVGEAPFFGLDFDQ